MRLPIYFFKGDPHKPVVIFIHGLGMNASQWLSPSESRIFGGAFPMSIVTRKPPEEIRLREKPSFLPDKYTIGNTFPLETSFNDLKEKGYTVITWNQTKPTDSIIYALNELKHIVKFAEALSNRGLILIGNSRGGLVARKYIEDNPDRVKAVITIATPHRGSSMAKWLTNISSFTAIVKHLLKIFPENIEKISQKLADFLSSEGVRELLPNSSLIHSLKKDHEGRENLFYIAGSNPTLFSIYEWKERQENESFILYPEKIFSFPHSLILFLPKKLIFPEWTEGDGLVSVESATDFGNSGRLFNLNHSEILIDPECRDYILQIVDTLI